MGSERENVAVVTGANKGLGFEIVKQLCGQYPGLVYLTSRDSTRGLEACEKIRKLGLKVCYHQLDVTDSDSVEIFVSYCKEKYGEIDLLINNAGVLYPKNTELSRETLVHQIEETMKVNFFSLVNFTESILPLLKNGGKIINISSSSGHLSRIPGEELRNRIKSTDSVEELIKLMNSYLVACCNGEEIEGGWGDSSYVVSKVGVNSYSFILHRRLSAKDISVTCVHPGYVQTDMTGGAGQVSAGAAAALPVRLALAARAQGYVWHDGRAVPWDGPDPRGFIDGRK
ncbi:carbonyl reductase [NADPH] 1 [Plutella xylostella]|uniref:carbonyl reductase [NADPH] 1 n=1 Tax=Plutella xylostella TaxID=51655 RepID=UPI002032300F|nr:carbonyl reductase [NADPH] 1 [Plutella xylostella]